MEPATPQPDTTQPASGAPAPTNSPPANSPPAAAAPAGVATDVPISRISGKPMRQEDVDALYAIIEKEVVERRQFLDSLPQARTPLGIVHHGLGAYVVACHDGTLWKSHGDSWEQLGDPIPGTVADLVARENAETAKRG